MGFQYEDEELELVYKGTTHKYRAPSAVEQQGIAKKFRDIDENTDAVDLYIEFFEMLGIPKEVLQKMSVRGISDMFVYTVGSKKN
jgi:hypothetical protein